MRATWVLIGFLAAFSGEARASCDGESTFCGEYLNLSFTGDGKTPSAHSLFSAQERAVQQPRTGASASATGDAAYDIPIDLPPARAMPSLSLSYSSAAGSHSVVGRGWTLSAGMTITRVVGAEATQAYGEFERVYRISGGGLDGLLVPDGSDWTYVSTGTLAVDVRTSNELWVVTANGVKTTLEPDQVVAGPYATSWHVRKTIDPHGERVDYTWIGNRLEAITYGDEVLVDLVYAERPHTSYRSSRGWVDVVDRQLERIDVSTTYGGPMTLQRSVDLVYDDVDAEPMLARVDEVAPGGDVWTLAWMEYASYAELTERDDGASVEDVPSVLSRTDTKVEGATRASSSQLEVALIDVTGDGLLDLLDARDWEADAWLWTPFGASWGDAVVEVADDVPQPVYTEWGDPTWEYNGFSLERSYTVRCDDDESTTYSARRLVDVDADGFSDLVQTDAAVPEPYYPAGTGSPPPFCAHRYTASPHTWTVWYGGPGGYFGPGEDAPAPVPFPRVDQGRVTKEMAFPLPPSIVVEGAVVDLWDVDGDGWLDVVAADGAGSVRVYFHGRTREDGWSVDPVTITDLSVDSLERTRQYLEVTEFVPSGLEWAQVTPSVEAIEVIRGFSDVNGDGLQDLVDTSGWTLTNPVWQVRLARGGRAVGQYRPAMAWAAPRGFLSHTDEGVGQAISCSSPTGVEPGEWTDLRLIVEDQVVDGVGSLEIQTPSMTLTCSVANADPDAPMRLDNTGRPQMRVVGLLDMDGDGRADLVDAEPGLFAHWDTQGGHASAGPHLDFRGRWYRNVGDGFEPSPFPVPLWFDGALSVAATRQVILASRENAYGGPPVAEGESWVSPSNSTRYEIHQVLDVDRDGLPDRVDLDSPYHTDGAGDVVYHPRAAGGTARPGLLTRIVSRTGAATTLAYVSSATTWPLGTIEGPHELANHRDLVSVIAVTDPVTDLRGERRLTYAEGSCALGRCMGFAWREEELWYSDPVATAGDLVGRTRTQTRSEPYRDHNLPLSTWTAEWTGSAVGNPWRTRYELHTEYEDVALDASAPIATRWAIARTSIDRGEDSSITPRTVRVDLVLDDLGHVLESEWRVLVEAGLTPILGAGQGWDLTLSPAPTLPAPGAPHADDTLVTATYVPNADGTLYLPCEIATWMRDGTAFTAIERGLFAYDGGGVCAAAGIGDLTSQVVQAGTPGLGPSPDLLASSTLSWTFTHKPSGAVSHVSGPAGFSSDQTFRFGDAVVASDTNGVGHLTTYAHDGWGRVTETVDPNGIRHRVAYDAFGRTVSESVKPKVGVWYETGRWQYKTFNPADESRGSSITVTRYGYDAPNASDETCGASVACVGRTEHQVLDGFGDTFQQWKAGPDAGSWVVQETWRDVTGQIVRVGYPHAETSFSATAGLAVDFTQWTEVDSFGRPLRSFSDHAAGHGEVHTRYAPGWSWTREIEHVGTTTNAYDKVLRLDSHGRVVEVYEGEGGDLDRTGTYTYDGRGRVLSFVDGADNAYQYQFDGAGRMQHVLRRPAGGAQQDWYSYAYDGPYPTQMWEEGPGGTHVVSWTWDAIGRVTSKSVLDRPSMLPRLYTWTWDTRWKGARSTATDPHGKIEYFYPADTFGRQGNPTRIARTWSLTGQTAQVLMSYDLDGNVLEKTWPGVTVQTHLTDTRWTSGYTLTAPGEPPTEVELDYDPEWGLPTGFRQVGSCGSACMAETRSWDTPSRLASIAWTRGGAPVGSIDYGWSDHGLLRSKAVGTEPVLRYEYDDFRRVKLVATVAKPGFPAKTLEKYKYDELGNLRGMSRGATETWNYGSATFSQPAFRDLEGTAVRELQTWDGQGRLSRLTRMDGATEQWERTYQYDGAGRLEKVSHEAGGSVAYAGYGYDGDDTLVLEGHWTAGVSPAWIYRFDGWRRGTATSTETVSALPMLAVHDGEIRWTFLEPDGHAVATYDASGALVDFELLGAYGLPIQPGDAHPPSTWQPDGFHGQEPDKLAEVVPMGVRHTLLRDGMWLQPEPLLYLGPTNGDLTNPRFFTGVYAAGNPVMMQDRSGAHPLVAVAKAVAVVVEVGLTAYDVYNTGTMVADYAQGKNGVTGLQVGVAVAATGVGVVTAGGGYSAGAKATASKISTMADTAADTARAVSTKIDNALGQAGSHADDAAKGANTGPELVATESGAVVVKGEDYNLVSPGNDDFVQIHGSKDHGGVGASSGLDFHTHKPELTMSPDGDLSRVGRPATPTTAADLDEVAERVISGDLVPK